MFRSIAAFDPKSVEWELYETQFDLFILANEVDDEKQKKALLLASNGMTALAYVRDFSMPTDLKDNEVDYKKLVKQLRDHYDKITAALVSRREFTNIRQQENKSVQVFAAALRAAVVHCQFGGDVDIRLRDQFVIGFRIDAI